MVQPDITIDGRGRHRVHKIENLHALATEETHKLKQLDIDAVSIKTVPPALSAEQEYSISVFNDFTDGDSYSLDLLYVVSPPDFTFQLLTVEPTPTVLTLPHSFNLDANSVKYYTLKITAPATSKEGELISIILRVHSTTNPDEVDLVLACLGTYVLTIEEVKKQLEHLCTAEVIFPATATYSADVYLQEVLSEISTRALLAISPYLSGFKIPYRDVLKDVVVSYCGMKLIEKASALSLDGGSTLLPTFERLERRFKEAEAYFQSLVI